MIAALRTVLGLVLVVLACAFATASAGAAGAAPTSSAECEPLDLANEDEVRARADRVTDVLEGNVLRVVPRTTVDGGEGKADPTSSPDAPQQDPDPQQTGWKHTVEVTQVFQGAQVPGQQVQVVTGIDPKDLGRLRSGQTYLFFVTTESGMDHLVADRCGGTQLLEDGPLTSRDRDALQQALDDSAEPAMDVSFATPDGGASSAPSYGRLAAPGAAVALIGVLGLLLLARVGSRRA